MPNAPGTEPGSAMAMRWPLVPLPAQGTSWSARPASTWICESM